MAKNQNHPLARYHEAIADTTSRFTFNHHPVPDPTGLMSTPQGFGQPFFHRPTNTVGVLFSKISNNLQGRVLPDGRRVADAKQMKGCYIFGARRLKGDVDEPLSARPNLHRVIRNLREDMDVARRELGTRSRKHLTLYNADNLYTNGRHVYEILPTKNGKFDVMFYMAAYRKDGSFIPFDMNDNSLHGKFARATKRIETVDTLEAARETVAHHWKAFSSDLWSQRNIFMRQGKRVIGQRILSDLVDFGSNHGKRVILSTIIVGGGFGAYSLRHGAAAGAFAAVAAGFAGALGHSLAHASVEVGLKEYFERRAKSLEAKSKLEITAYGFDSDVSDHFKIQTPENLAKVCPHIDLQRFNPEDFELLSLDQFSLQKDRELAQDNLQPNSLAGHLLFMGQRGFSSQAHILDQRTELRLFQSGVTRLMHEREDGIIVVHAQYRPEMCTDDRLRLAQCHINQFEGQIVRLEYNRDQPTFSKGIGEGLKAVSYESMMDEIEDEVLFAGQEPISEDVWTQSCEAISTAFSNPACPSFPWPATVGIAPRLSAVLPEFV